MEQQPAPPSPGDLITADLMNNILDRLLALESRTGFSLGSDLGDTHTIVALGSGIETNGGIWLDGALLSGNLVRGVNLIILGSDLHIKFQGTYDIVGNNANSVELANDLEGRTSIGDVIVAVTHETFDPQNPTAKASLVSLDPTAKAALAAVGGAALGGVTQGNAAAAFIGMVPAVGVTAGSAAGLGFDYVVSVLPLDASLQGAGLPFAWGVYSTQRQRFVLGGAASNPSPPPVIESPPKGKETKEKEKEKEKDKEKEKEKEKDKDKEFIKEKENLKDRIPDKLQKEKDKEKEKERIDKVQKEFKEKDHDQIAAPSAPSGDPARHSAEGSLPAGNQRSFIRPDERPPVGQQALQQSTGDHA